MTNSFDKHKKPIVGFYVKDSLVRYLENQGNSNSLATIIKTVQMANISLYFFSLNDVNLQTKTIDGAYYNEATGCWTKEKFPYPDVLYVRGGAVIPKKKFWQFNQQLKEMGVKKINSGPTFNKWNIISILKRNQELAHHLPPTELYKTVKNLKEMISKYKEVYLKACVGRKGIQVMRIKELAKGSYEYKYFYNNQLHTRVVDFRDLCYKIKSFFGKKRFIIQKAIELPNTGDSIFDMRAELQRTGTGELEVLEILVRVGQPGSPITTHSNSYLFDDFFINKYPLEDIAAIKDKAKDFLIKVYTTLEFFYGSYGEIGIDFAIDKKGDLWFIECNSRSTRVSLLKAASEETKLKAYLNPFEYAKFIYKQGKES